MNVEDEEEFFRGRWERAIWAKECSARPSSGGKDQGAGTEVGLWDSWICSLPKLPGGVQIGLEMVDGCLDLLGGRCSHPDER